MPTNYTQHCHLSQWEPEDKVVRTDFNADNAKIDAAIQSVEAAKADKTALSALAQTVDSKADKSALSSLSGTVSSHTTSLARKGNCTICFDTYTGTGTFGTDSPTTRSFSGKPLFVAFCDGRSLLVAVNGAHTVFYRDGGTSQALNASWSRYSVSLSTNTNASVQMNVAGRNYTVLALIAAGE